MLTGIALPRNHWGRSDCWVWVDLGGGKHLLDSAVEFRQILGFQFSAKVSFIPLFCFQFCLGAVSCPSCPLWWPIALHLHGIWIPVIVLSCTMYPPHFIWFSLLLLLFLHLLLRHKHICRMLRTSLNFTHYSEMQYTSVTPAVAQTPYMFLTHCPLGNWLMFLKRIVMTHISNVCVRIYNCNVTHLGPVILYGDIL